MIRTSSVRVRELKGATNEAAGRLSLAQVAALATQPKTVRSALPVAASELTLDDACCSACGFEADRH